MSFTIAKLTDKLNPSTLSVGNTVNLTVTRNEGNEDDGVFVRPYCIETIIKTATAVFLEFEFLNLSFPVEVYLF